MPRDVLLLVFFASLGLGAHVGRLTTAGKRALQGYLDHMEALIRATRAR